MRQGLSGSGRTTGSIEPVRARLTHRHDLPARVQLLLTGMYDLCSRTWPQLLDVAVNEFERRLFERAEKSRNSAEQQECFHTLKKVTRGRAEIAPRFLHAMEDSLASFDVRARAAKAGQHTATGTLEARELVLVDSIDLEESLALQDLAVRAEIRQTMPLYMLGHRFGVLVALPALDAKSLPVGPAALGAALRHAAAHLDISIEHRVLLYQTVDRVAMHGLGPFYEALNAYLIDQRILAHLRVLLPGVARPAATRTSADDSASTTHRADPAGAEAHRAGPAGAAAGPPAGNYAHGAAMPADERDSELFATLRELLAGRGHGPGTETSAPVADSYVPNGAVMQSVLGALQSRPIKAAVLGSRVVPRAVSQLKHDLMSHLRQLAPDGTVPHLAAEDSDTIDLVGMLFERIMQDIKPDSSTQAMLTKLQVPVMRVALNDKSFFTRRGHPARQLLNAIAETGTRWADTGDGEGDPALVEKMQLVIERVTAEFDGDVGLFEELLKDLSRHMRLVTRKAEVSERRQVDAAKGREKLAIARKTASAAIAERVAAVRPSAFMRTLLEQAWTDVLALTLLRHGENSEPYWKQLDVVDKLLASSASAKGKAAKPPPPVLRARIATSLADVGLEKKDVQNVIKRLFAPASATDEDAPSRTELAIKLKNKPHLGIGAASEPPRRVPPKAPASLDLNAAEQKMLEQLKTVPFGTWFEFVVNQQGASMRRKLSWFSPVTGHCLFVNQRGARDETRGFEQLARDLVRGQAHFVKPEQESLVDRAWKAIVASLKQLAGRGPGAEPTPA
jgi:hypothetical protein